MAFPFSAFLPLRARPFHTRLIAWSQQIYEAVRDDIVLRLLDLISDSSVKTGLVITRNCAYTTGLGYAEAVEWIGFEADFAFFSTMTAEFA